MSCLLFYCPVAIYRSTDPRQQSRWRNATLMRDLVHPHYLKVLCLWSWLIGHCCVHCSCVRVVRCRWLHRPRLKHPPQSLCPYQRWALRWWLWHRPVYNKDSHEQRLWHHPASNIATNRDWRSLWHSLPAGKKPGSPHRQQSWEERHRKTLNNLPCGVRKGYRQPVKHRN